MGQPSDDRSLPAPLTDTLLRSWLRCRRKAWLDRHGPEELQRWNAHRSLALQEQLLRFQQLLPQKPRQGLQACEEGHQAVMGVRLRGSGPQELSLEAHPTLLLRVNTPSRWGGHGYQPVLARQGRRTTREHRLLLVLWGRLLAHHQGARVPQGLVLAGQGGRLVQERLTLSPALEGQVDESLMRLAEDLQRSTPPSLVNDRKKCTLCSWRQLCDQEAAREGHLSEVSGVGSKRRDLLLQVGIHTLRDLAEADPSQLATALEPHGDQHRDMAPQLVAQAQVQATGQPERLLEGDGLEELEQAPGVLIYDIESDPDALTLWWGHPYRRWSSFLADSPLDNLRESEARVYLAYGTKDRATPPVSGDLMAAELDRLGRDVTTERRLGESHGFSRRGQSAVAGFREIFSHILVWWLS